MTVINKITSAKSYHEGTVGELAYWLSTCCPSMRTGVEMPQTHVNEKYRGGLLVITASEGADMGSPKQIAY